MPAGFVRTFVWLGFLVAALAVALTSEPSLPPPAIDPDSLLTWLEEVGTVAAGFAVVRLIAAGFIAYLLAVTLLTLVARAARPTLLRRLVTSVTTPSARRLLRAALGTSALLAAPSPAFAQASRRPPDPPPVMRLIAEAIPAPEPAPLPAPVHESVPPVEHHEPPPPDRHVVVRGEHLWGIAEAVLARAIGRPASDDDVAPYWQALVEANRSRLADPNNPDLIFAGQTLQLPPIPAGR